MHLIYGKQPRNQCKSCCNFVRVEFGRKSYQKCKAYGISSSMSTDWVGRYMACGFHGIDFDNSNKIEVIRQGKNIDDNIPLEGQVTMPL